MPCIGNAMWIVVILHCLRITIRNIYMFLYILHICFYIYLYIICIHIYSTSTVFSSFFAPWLVECLHAKYIDLNAVVCLNWLALSWMLHWCGCLEPIVHTIRKWRLIFEHKPQLLSSTGVSSCPKKLFSDLYFF